MQTEVRQVSTANHMWIWFGAAVSIAEIMTGMLFAPLGMVQGFSAIVIGHLIGLAFLYFIGLIGAQTGMTAMNTAGISFGSQGKKIFALLNVCQLIGWTAVMVVNGSDAVNLLLHHEGQTWHVISSLFVGGLVLVWSVVKLNLRSRINTWTVMTLLLLCVIITYNAAVKGALHPMSDMGMLSFGNAVELALVMPLSWLPLIADYNREAKSPIVANRVGALAYTVGSIWMYTLGLAAAVYTEYTDVSMFFYSMGLGLAALIVVIFSTVTTTYLDVRSAAISFNAVTTSISERTVAAAVAIVGIILAIFVPVSYYEEFLYLIGSCFTPMVAILLADYYILKRREISAALDSLNIVLWVAGFALYRYFLTVDSPIGISIPVFAIIMAITVIARKIVK